MPRLQTDVSKFGETFNHPGMRRELRTIRRMIGIYCRDRHGSDDLCGDCAELFEYATRRLAKCVFGEDKPACVDCTIHCYSRVQRERIRAVMRYSGPCMIFRHPLLAIFHVLRRRRMPVSRDARSGH
ncbi:MAG: nitrous oxide-stimulated promoter family protein [Verrucomicrobia bacterium]|nr:nitrous oxide-stimulated promoter family protein [Verrucomicrobiota bacterium]MCF7709242.1 nitrous oxide-stimulated promoter family protein [Verrucomicrobiota bacterium]